MKHKQLKPGPLLGNSKPQPGKALDAGRTLNHYPWEPGSQVFTFRV